MELNYLKRSVILFFICMKVCWSADKMKQMTASKNDDFDNTFEQTGQIWVKVVRSILMCVFTCSNDSQCRSVSYNSVDKWCQAFNTDFSNRSKEGTPENGWHHFDLTVIDPCANVYCQNGGTCNNGECFCVFGFEGPNCEDRPNPCVPNDKCKNGGECQRSGPTYSCQCAPGYMLPYCDEDVSASTALKEKSDHARTCAATGTLYELILVLNDDGDFQ